MGGAGGARGKLRLANPLGCALVALLFAGSATAGRDLETTIQDDALLLHRSETQVRATVKQIAELGADRVRITAGWSALAPSPREKRRPQFDEEDSRTYPDYGFQRLDRAVVAATDAGLKVQLDVAFWAPRWAVPRRFGSVDRQRYAPDAASYGRFARAVAKRYSGTFADPARPGLKLPPVRMYTTWNEPNEPSFLAPQWRKTKKGGFRPASPHVYRRMHNAAYEQIKSVSQLNLVLVGGTSAKGSEVTGRGGVPPLVFLRELTCTTAAGGALAVPECRGYEPLKADGYAHHPYSLDTQPGTSDPHPDDAPIADVDRLADTLAFLHAHGRLARELPLYLTEYGYESSPPDPTARHTPEEQAAFLGWATYLAYKQPATRMFAQFLLRDIDADESGFPASSPRHWRDYQTGLLYADGTPKPAAQAFKIPFHAQPYAGEHGPVLLLFGGVRPGSGRKLVRVERQDPASGRWLPIPTARRGCFDATPSFFTEPDGFFVHTTAYLGAGRYRLGWSRGENVWEYGAEVAVDDSAPLAVPGGSGAG